MENKTIQLITDLILTIVIVAMMFIILESY